MEPYLNRISGVAVTHEGCGSSRKNLYQAKNPPAATSSTIAIRKIFNPVCVLDPAMAAPLNSKCFQVLHERILFGGTQLGSIDPALVPRVRISRLIRVVKKILLTLFLRHVRNKSHIALIINVIA